MNLKMKVLKDKYAVVKLKADARIPSWILDKEFVSITRTEEELSIVLSEPLLGEYLDDIGNGEVFKGFRSMKIEGPLDFSLIGILSEITGALAEEKISVFAISTFNTDYVLVGDDKLYDAVSKLGKLGIDFI